MSLQKIILKTKEYLQTPAVVRFENLFIHHLADDFNIPGYEIEKHDRLLAVRKKGLKSNKIITAHLDRHGIVINKQQIPEYAGFNAKKHYNIKNTSKEHTFIKSGERFVGECIYAYDSHGRVLGINKLTGFRYDFDSKDLFFEIPGFEKLPPNTPVAYMPKIRESEQLFSAQIDNAISIAVIRQLAAEGFDGTVLFAAEEEIGRSWKHLAAYLNSREKPSQEIITIDTAPYDNKRAIEQGRVVLRNKDENGIFNKKLVDKLKKACNEKGIKYDIRDELIDAYNSQLPEGTTPKKLGKTELGRIIQHTNAEFNGATLQLPTVNYHTNHETTSKQAITNYYNALKHIL